MRSRWNLPVYLAYLVVSVVAIGYIVAQMGLSAPWTHRYTVTAVFSDAADILSNNEVYMNGARVGYVGDVSVVGGQAHVQLVVSDAHALPLHTDASAEVRKKNLLGETYIDLQRGSSAGTLGDGGTIGVSHTVPITEIDQVLAIFDPETVQRVQLLINGLGTATDHNGANMNSSAGSADQLITALNGPALELSVRQQQVQDIVLELQRFYTVLANQRQQVLQEFGTWNQVMGQLAAQDTGISGTVQQADSLLRSLSSIVSGENGNIRSLLAGAPAALTSTNAFLTQANTISGDLAPYRQYINDIFPALQTSFRDTDPNGNHMWSVFSTNCTSAPISPALCAGSQPSSYTAPAPGDVWASYTPGAAG